MACLWKSIISCWQFSNRMRLVQSILDKEVLLRLQGTLIRTPQDFPNKLARDYHVIAGFFQKIEDNGAFEVLWEKAYGQMTEYYRLIHLLPLSLSVAEDQP